MRPIYQLVFLCISFAAIACGQEKSNDERSVDAIRHPAELELSLWADSTQLANPVAFTFDNHGRMFLCETFRQNKGVEDNRGHMTWLDDDLAAQTVEDRLAYFKKHLEDKFGDYELEEDRITVISDEDGDGRADKDWVYADGFRDALTGTGAGVLVVDNDVYYTCIPKLWKLSDTDGDDMADSQTALHHGYGVRVAFRGHDLHGLVMGPDGRIYFSIGDRGYNIKTDGEHFKDPESGAIFRCELDGSQLEVFCTGMRNPQELAFDDYGNLFTGDNNSDSGDEARWVHAVQGSDTGWRMAFQYLPDRGPWNREKLWHPRHAGQPAFIVPPIRNFADGPSGLTYYPGTGLGDAYLGTFFLCDFRGDTAISGVRSFKMKPRGASFEMSEDRKFLWNVLATDIDFAPDGGLYLTDWITGWEGVNRGRVVRVTNPIEFGSERSKEVQAFLAQDLSDIKPPKLRPYLGHADRRVRMKAQFELARRKAAWHLAKSAREDESPRARIHAIWGLGQVARSQIEPWQNKLALTRLIELAGSDDAHLRQAAITTLGDLDIQKSRMGVVKAIIKTLGDADPHVQASAAIAIGKVGAPTALEPLIAMIVSHGDADAVLRHAGVMGLVGVATLDQLAELGTHTSKAVRMAGLLALRRHKSPLVANFLNDQDPLVVVEAARAIHDAPIYEALPALAAQLAKATDDEALVRRTLTANFRLGQASHAKAIASFIGSGHATEAMQLEAMELLETWANPSSRDRVLGMWRPLEARPSRPAELALIQLLPELGSVPASVAVKAAQAAATLELSEAKQAISRMVTSNKYEPRHRAELLRSLVALKFDGIQQVLTQSLADDAPEVRSAARSLLLDVDRQQAIPSLIAAFKADATLERQAALAAAKDVDDVTLRAALRDLVNSDLLSGNYHEDSYLDLVEAAKQNGVQKEVEPFLAKYADSPYGERQLSLYGGDAERGEKLFRENVSLSCLRCHSVGDTGGRVGPNMAGIGKLKTRDYLLEAIVDPNKKIAEGFGTLIVVTEDGIQRQGIVSKEDDELIHMIDPDGNRFHVEKAELIDRQNGNSAMPDDLIKHLDAFQLRDLIAYLASLETPWVDETKQHEE